MKFLFKSQFYFNKMYIVFNNIMLQLRFYFDIRYIIDELVKSQKSTLFVIPAKAKQRESSNFNRFWMPDQVRHDGFWTFYESIK